MPSDFDHDQLKEGIRRLFLVPVWLAKVSPRVENGGRNTETSSNPLLGG